MRAKKVKMFFSQSPFLQPRLFQFLRFEPFFIPPLTFSVKL